MTATVPNRQYREGLALRQEPFLVDIESGAAVSEAIDITDQVCRGVSIAYQAITDCYFGVDFHLEGDVDESDQDVWYALTDANDTRVLAKATDGVKLTILPAEAWAGLRMSKLRIRSLNAAGSAAVNQLADRTLRVSILA